MRILPAVLGMFLLAAGCAVKQGTTRPMADASPIHAVHALVEAFNAHDPAGMADLVDADVEWLSVAGSKIAVEAKGRDALRQAMVSYFASFPDVRSTLSEGRVSGPFVAVEETAAWTGKNGRRSQSALAVYEIRDGLVLRVWYYYAAS